MMISRRKLIIYNWISPLIPDTGRCNRFRMAILRWCGVNASANVSVRPTVKFFGYGSITIGEGSTIRDGVIFHVEGGGEIILGHHVLIGENVILESYASSANSALLTFGNHVDFMMGSLASANGNAKVRIGNNCKIAHNVAIKATEHQIDPNGVCIGGEIAFRDITISDGCWICAGAIITPGVAIGSHNVVGAGAVVINDSPDYVLLAGVPAVVKKHYMQ